VIIYHPRDTAPGEEPQRNEFTHLKEREVVDHRGVLDEVWRMRSAPTPVGEFIDAMSFWHSLGALDQQTFYKMQAGVFAGEEMRLVAEMPPQVAAMIHATHPDFLKDKKEFYRVLREHPEYAVPGVV